MIFDNELIAPSKLYTMTLCTYSEYYVFVRFTHETMNNENPGAKHSYVYIYSL